MVTIQSADLFYCEGSSDKEYHIQLVLGDMSYSVNAGYSVHVQWGRKGSMLQSGVKVSDVLLDKAQKVYDRVYNEKVGKGYKEVGGSGFSAKMDSVKAKAIIGSAAAVVGVGKGLSAAAIKATVKAIKVASKSSPVVGKGGVIEDGAIGKRRIHFRAETFIPQLLNPIDEDLLEEYLRDDAYGMQEKKDGRHIIGCYRGGDLVVYNKKGKSVGYPSCYRDALSVSCVIDGEAIGDVFHVFDLLELMGTDLRGYGYGDRYDRLSSMGFGTSIRVVPLAIGYAAKRAMYDELVAGKKEGVVFKRLAAFYVPGRPSKLGDMLKYKFYSTCSLRVCGGRVGKHSIGLEILEGSKWVGVGNCTVAPSTPLPKIGCIIEVRYLNYQKGGSLYQPTYLGIRDDVDEGECLITQLKHKALED